MRPPTASCRVRLRRHHPPRHRHHRGRSSRTATTRSAGRHARRTSTAPVGHVPAMPPACNQQDPALVRLSAARQRRRWPARFRGAVLATVSLLAAVGLVLSAALPASATTVHVVALAGSLDEVLNNLRNWIMGILALVATVFLTIGGLRYVVASGDAGEVSKAKECFKNAAMGYALAALAPLVIQILRSIVGT